MFNKQKWLDLAEAMDALRVVPQSLLYGYFIFAGVYVVKMSTWYMALPAAERTAEVSAFVGGTITAICGIGSLCVKFYVQSGRSWDGKPTPNL